MLVVLFLAVLANSQIILGNNDQYIQTITFSGINCENVTQAKLHRLSNGCVKDKSGFYSRAYCTEKEGIIESYCDESCQFCSSVQTSPLYGCINLNAMYSQMQVCGQVETKFPPMLWETQHEESYPSCKKSPVKQALGTKINTCEILLTGAQFVSCNGTHWTRKEYPVSSGCSKDPFVVKTGSLNVCEGEREMICEEK